MIKCCGFVLEQLASLVPEYTHIASAIEAHWGTSRCNDVFHKVMVMDREDRKGLPMGVYTSLLSLFVVHVSEYGTYDNPMVFEHLNVDLLQLDQSHGGYLTAGETYQSECAHRPGL